MKFNLFLFVLLLAVIGCKDKSTLSDMIEKSKLSDDPYLISSSQVGVITRGTNVHHLYSLFPAKQIKLSKSKEDYFNQELDNYNIYNSKGQLLLTATPDASGDTASFINRIVIKDSLFKTAKGIGLNSTLGELRHNYMGLHYFPSAGGVIVTAPDISASFLFDKNELGDKWWNKETNQLIESNLPDQAKISSIIVFWSSPKVAKPALALFTSDFWQDMLRKLITWAVTELPSIIILVILFMVLLRLEHFTVTKMKKLALKKTQRTENINKDEAAKRINTLTGIIHGIGRVFLWGIFLLILLGKFNINIAPILASAGIVGLAVGFGAQELVRDFISGFFILLENQLRTGDWAIINGTEGLVEKIELRTITLRDSSGTVHIFQNGKINSLSNMTKEWSAIVLNIGIAYKEDTDYASKLMKQVGDELLNDPVYKDIILEPITINGVNDFADSAVVIRVTLKTKPMQQWAVGREYRRRLKKVFDAKNVEFPFPYRTLTFDSEPIRLRVEQEVTKNNS